MRILLADDERLVRLSIRSMLEELSATNMIPQILIEEASNGSELELKLKSFQPHLAFVDIRMPGKSGLEVMSEAFRNFPDISWVLLTGYAEFTYAKRAIEIGVIDYLVKPASSGDLLRVVSLARDQGKEKAQISALIAQNKISSLFRRTLSAEFDTWFDKRRFYGGLLLYRGEEKLRREAFQEIRELLVRWNYEKLSQHVVAVAVTCDLDGFYIPICLDSPEIREDFLPGAWLSELGKKIKACSGTWDWIQKKELLLADQFVSELLETEAEVSSIRAREVIRAGENEESSDSSTLSVKRREQVEKALSLVQEKFCEEIGLAQIADELSLTPNYLSGEFKTATGINFTDYITRLRMEKAGELLKTPGISVKAAAGKLGYVSSRYFSKLFTQYYGKKPSEYIESSRS